MGKRQTYRRRSRKRPTRQQRRKTQNRHSRRRQRGGVSDRYPTTHNLDGFPVRGGVSIVKGGVVMDEDTFRYRQQDGGDSALD